MHGGCLCGAVRYELTAPPSNVAHCHCSMCRKHSGALFLTYAAYPRDAVTFTRGELVPYRSSAAATRSHCATCGSPISFIFDAEPQVIWLTLGGHDEPQAVQPREHWCVADKLSWYQITDGLPQYPGLPA